jgi:hypothetical protein
MDQRTTNLPSFLQKYSLKSIAFTGMRSAKNGDSLRHFEDLIGCQGVTVVHQTITFN